MSTLPPSNSSLPVDRSIEGPAMYTLLWAALITTFIGSVSFITSRKRSKLPLVNGPGRFQLRVTKQLEFLKNGVEIFLQAKRKYPGQAFRLVTEQGEVVVLPPAFAHTIRNEDGLSFSRAIETDFNSHIPGFDPFGLISHDKEIVQAVARKQLTKSLKPLSREATFATNLALGNSSNWQEIVFKPSILDIIARLSSRVFLGEEVCRNPEWLEITKSYTIDAFKAAITTSFVPPVLRVLLRWFSQDYKRVKQELNSACDIINPVIERRRKLKEEAREKGTQIPKFNDAMDWVEEEADGQPYGAAEFQLLLSFAAIHTTTDLLCETLLLLANEPELITPLRKEMIQVLGVEGWSKSALYSLKLMDSTIKEAQRIKPTSYLGMRRYALQDVTLPEAGFTIFKGERVMVDATNMINPDVHEDPTKFDIYRFLKMREQPGQANKAQLVTTSPDQIAFGHGKHACPGRFFAVNEIKIALCHLLMKYDWKLAEGTTVEPIVNGVMHGMDPKSRLMFRRRKEEIDIDELSFK